MPSILEYMQVPVSLAGMLRIALRVGLSELQFKVMDARSILGVGVGVCIGTTLWTRLSSCFRIHMSFGLPDILTVVHTLRWPCT